MVRYLKNYDDAELRRIGQAARDLVLAAHTSDVRAQEFEQAVEIVRRDEVKALVDELIA
jgi:hypothetical protein